MYVVYYADSIKQLLKSLAIPIRSDPSRRRMKKKIKTLADGDCQLAFDDTMRELMEPS